MTNFEYVLNKKHVEKTTDQIVQEFRLFCNSQKGCDDCAFEEFCTVFTYNQLYKWLAKEYDKSEWVDKNNLD